MIPNHTELHGNRSSTDLPVGFTDSDFADDLDDRKSTSGYVFTLGNGAISWPTHNSHSSHSARWKLRTSAHRMPARKPSGSHLDQLSLFTRLLGLDAYPQGSFVGSQGAIQLAKNPKFHARTKHIGVRYHFIRDACERNAIRTTYLPT